MPFRSPHIRMSLSKATLKALTDAEGDRVRLADVTLSIEPLPYRLAAELDEAMLTHLFDDTGEIRTELKNVKLTPHVTRQLVTVKGAIDIPEPLIVLRHVRVVELSATKKTDSKTGDSWLVANLVVEIDLAERKTRDFLIDTFGETPLFTFEAEQGDMLDDGVRGAVRRLQDLAGEDGSMELTTTDEKGRRKGVRITKDDVESIH